MPIGRAAELTEVVSYMTGGLSHPMKVQVMMGRSINVNGAVNIIEHYATQVWL